MPRIGGRTLWPGFELLIEDGGELVESAGREPEPTWRHVDKKGHGHFWLNGDYPTLDERWTGCEMGHGDDCKGARYYVCRICGEPVTPGTRPVPPAWVPGPITYKLTVHSDNGSCVWEFGEDRWTTLNDMIRHAVFDAMVGLDPTEVRYDR
jgi:hypothetical protein